MTCSWLLVCAVAKAIGHVKLHRISHDVILQHLHEPLKEVVRLNEIKKVLSDIFLFKNLNEERLERVVRSLEKRRYDAGTAVVQQGDEATHFFLIHRGTIQVTKDGEKVRTLGRCRWWDLSPSLSLSLCLSLSLSLSLSLLSLSVHPCLSLSPRK